MCDSISVFGGLDWKLNRQRCQYIMHIEVRNNYRKNLNYWNALWNFYWLFYCLKNKQIKILPAVLRAESEFDPFVFVRKMSTSFLSSRCNLFYVVLIAVVRFGIFVTLVFLGRIKSTSLWLIIWIKGIFLCLVRLYLQIYFGLLDYLAESIYV